MRSISTIYALLGIVLIITVSPSISAETKIPGGESSKYLDAVRTFADNVLKYGRDTYGPKHTPLFVDGLNIHTHEPVKWIDPDGRRWILSNFASQQTLLRTLDGLTGITGDPKYRKAAVEAIEYAFENLRHPNGLFYWGHTTAYDAGADDVSFRTTIPGGGTHALKLDYPYYQLMWEVNPQETKKSIEAFWSAHIIDWSNLDFDRYASFNDALEEPWDYEYKRYPTFFKSKKSDSAAGTWTGTSLIHAGTTLYRLSGKKQPLIWSKRLAERFIDTRHPKTGISYESYTYRFHQFGDDLKEHFNDPYTRHFPQECFDIDLFYYYGENVTIYAWMSMLLVGEMLGEEGKEFKQWALEEFTAMGKASYRKKDNSFTPILTDGTSLEGYEWKKAPGTGSKGMVVKPIPADMPFFWGYSVAYRITGDEFIWAMVRDIALGNNFGDIGQTSAHTPELHTETSCSDVYALLAFLQLYEKTDKSEYLDMAQVIGDNILLNKFHKGFFVLSAKHIFTRFDCLEPLVLLRLYAAMKNKIGSIPCALPSVPLFIPPYRYKEQGVDRIMIYTLTESPEVSPESSDLPLSLQEAAAIGDVNLARTLIEHETNADSLEDSFLKTALHRAAMSGHKDVAELLLAEGAEVDTKDRGCRTPLHLAAESGHKEIVELLITEGADANARDASGRMSIHYAVVNKNKVIAELLIDTAIQSNTFEGRELARVKRLLSKGLNVNTKRADNDGTLLHFAAQAGYVYVAAYLIDREADIDAKNSSGQTPLQVAMQKYFDQPTTALLLLDAGATATDWERKVILFKASQETGRYGLKRAKYEVQEESSRSTGALHSQHDIAITGVPESTTCVRGDVIPITCKVENRGYHKESFMAALLEGEAPIASQSITLAAPLCGGVRKNADIIYDPETVSWNVMGNRVCIGGDVNQDGFADLLVGAFGWRNNHGRAYLHLGGSDMDAVPDVVFTGLNEGDGYSNQSGVFGDVNGDGYDDVVIGAVGWLRNIHDGYVHIFFGGPHMDNVPDLILKPSESGRNSGFGFVTTGDVNNDGYCDVLVSERSSGRVSLFWGGNPMDTHTNVVFKGRDHAFSFGHRMAIGGDVNGDGYNDIIMGAREGGKYKQGQAYFYYGNTKDKIDVEWDWLFEGETPGDFLGSGVDIFDIDNDGYADIIVGARYAYENFQGRIYVYWGSENFDGSQPGLILEGQEISSLENFECGYINDDSYGDILVGGWQYPGPPYKHGRVYLFHGNTKTLMDTDYDYLFEGEGCIDDYYGIHVGLGDVNKDGYTDALVGAWGVNFYAGRAYLYYGPFHNMTDITFTWDTTNASIGKHTLKVEIPPVPGEQNSEDNAKTVTIEVKEPSK